ncbi:mycofactocin-associated electron transfer flavoprotein alpha subunit [Streptomyces sp. NPDC004647]|uniref:mycofactocin-associated electron transfer flavoprotein alpha subunit n=1 Tax=Streptomyces sp. NPDC004647 TaxID=3154671 RepID=UPI0033A3B7E8
MTAHGQDLRLPSLAVVRVRDGAVPPGTDEAVAEAGGAVLLVGDGTRAALSGLAPAGRAWTAEFPRGLRPGPGTTAAALAPHLARVHALVLPASADGRELAPRLAHALHRPLLAGAVEVLPDGAVVSRREGRAQTRVTVQQAFVATLVAAVRGVESPSGHGSASAAECPTGLVPTELTPDWPTDIPDPRVLEVLDPGPTGTALADASRILGAGAGLGSPDAVGLLHRVAAALGASVGATRVVTDAGWLEHERQIGTTGVAVDPDVYIAFGVSGAGQHTGGLGTPRLVISVNTDPHCPMSAMADLAIVADAPAVLGELCARLESAAHE